jgi:hypothetical protein
MTTRIVSHDEEQQEAEETKDVRSSPPVEAAVSAANRRPLRRRRRHACRYSSCFSAIATSDSLSASLKAAICLLESRSRHVAKSVTADFLGLSQSGRITNVVTSKRASVNHDSAQVYIRPLTADYSLSGSTADDPAKLPSAAGDVPKSLNGVRYAVASWAWANDASVGYGDGPRGSHQSELCDSRGAGITIEVLRTLSSVGYRPHDVDSSAALEHEVAHTIMTAL